MDVQYNKLTKLVGRSLRVRYDTLRYVATIDVPWRNSLSPEFGTTFEVGLPLFLEVGLLEFPYNTMSKEASNTSFIRLAVLV